MEDFVYIEKTEEMDMKVLLVNGSAKEHGCTDTALHEAAKTLEQEGILTEVFWVGSGSLRDCIGCGQCNTKQEGCIFDDDCVNTLIAKAKDADGFLFGSPVYYFNGNVRA